MSKKQPKFHCKSEAQKTAIRKSYAIKAKQQKTPHNNEAAKTQNSGNVKKDFPKEFPFWARLKIYKNRTTLVIDEAPAMDKQKHEMVDGYVHREATHTQGHGEPVIPNPDKDDSKPMYLKRPSSLPKRFFKPHNKDLDMPEKLRQRYEKNNYKDNNDKKD